MSQQRAVVTPGPVLTVYDGGRVLARLALSPSAALHLLHQLATDTKG